MKILNGLVFLILIFNLFWIFFEESSLKEALFIQLFLLLFGILFGMVKFKFKSFNKWYLLAGIFTVATGLTIENNSFQNLVLGITWFYYGINWEFETNS